MSNPDRANDLPGRAVAAEIGERLGQMTTGRGSFRPY